MTVRFDTKIAIAVRADLLPWQKLNVTAFLASGIAASIGDIIGKPYEDGSGNTYLELFRQPVVVYAADPASSARPISARWPGRCRWRSTPWTCSRPATTTTTGP
jgi:Uncharacterized protein conserved in bacteria